MVRLYTSFLPFVFLLILFQNHVQAQRSPSLGTIDYFSDALTNTIRTVRLSDDKILVTWLDNGSASSNNLKAIVGTVSGTSVTFTPSDEVTITSNVFTTSHGLVSFSSTKAAIVYEANLTTDEMKYNVLDITGTTITVGGQDDFGPSGGLQVGTTKATSAVAISDSQLVVTYEEENGANDVFKVIAGTVSGTTITWGTAISPNSDDGNNADVVRLTDSKFVLAYEDQTTSTGVGKLRVGTVDGSNGITFGIEETFADSFDINIAKLAALSETEVVVVWEYITGTQYANARYATIAGTSITFPTQTIPTFYTDEGVDDMAIAPLSATEFIVAVDGGSGDDSEVYTGVVSSNNITMTSDGGFVIITGQADDIQIAPLTSDKAVVVYTNDQAVGTSTGDRGDYVVASYTATTNPEINVQGNSVDIVSGDDTPSTGDHTDFGTGNPISRTFTIQNTGTGTLTLGSNAVTINGTNASEFTVTSQPATTVSSSSSTTFTVEFSSLVASTRTAQININSDDVHEPNYFFDIEGVGAAAVVNNVPTDISLSVTTIYEAGTGTNTNIAILSTTDADGSDTHTYSLVAGSGDTDNGSFNIDGANLRSSAALASGSYSVRINTNDGTDDFAKQFSVVVLPSTIDVAAKVFLQGAFNGSNGMSTTLEDSDLVSASAPYNGTNNHSGSESVASAAAVPDNVVDWVLVELREAGSAAAANNASKVGSASGFLMNDGTIKAIDGTSDLTVNLSGNTGSEFYVVIYHRNHLPIMSNADIDGSGGTLTVDFTTAQGTTFLGASALVTLNGTSTFYGMPAGDIDQDGDIDATDLSTWRGNNGEVYSYSSNGTSDFNLDGVINAVDRNDFHQKNTSKTRQVPST